MAIEAHRCNNPECKGFVVFENADFDFEDIPTDKECGCYVFTRPSCSECGKEYLVIPHYIVIDVNDKELGEYEVLEPACMTSFEKRERERKFNSETNPHMRIMMFLIQRNYTYTVADVIAGYLKHKETSCYLSHSMRDCISHLEHDIKKILEDEI
ncbi:hypothetical protein [Paenibacillus apiarius]|uniref:hypothetical protein n=1 Tax=Paenibacillus apiarius TaxID=46240 RepID=UPI003B3AD98D